MTHHHTVPLAVALLISLSGLQGHAAPAGPFTGMAGSWSGVGSLTMANGAQERMRCRANYQVGGNGSEMQLGRILPRLPRAEMIVQTKVAPAASAEEFRATFSLGKKQFGPDYGHAAKHQIEKHGAELKLGDLKFESNN